jgi:hypothetical protein
MKRGQSRILSSRGLGAKAHLCLGLGVLLLPDGSGGFGLSTVLLGERDEWVRRHDAELVQAGRECRISGVEINRFERENRGQLSIPAMKSFQGNKGQHWGMGAYRCSSHSLLEALIARGRLPPAELRFAPGLELPLTAS